jgi:hypothetical protein
VKFCCPKCKHNVINVTYTKEITISEWHDALHLFNDRNYSTSEWLGTCDLCGYGFKAKTLIELLESLETVGAIK